MITRHVRLDLRGIIRPSIRTRLLFLFKRNLVKIKIRTILILINVQLMPMALTTLSYAVLEITMTLDYFTRIII